MSNTKHTRGPWAIEENDGELDITADEMHGVGASHGLLQTFGRGLALLQLSQSRARQSGGEVT